MYRYLWHSPFKEGVLIAVFIALNGVYCRSLLKTKTGFWNIRLTGGFTKHDYNLQYIPAIITPFPTKNIAKIFYSLEVDVLALLLFLLELEAKVPTPDEEIIMWESGKFLTADQETVGHSRDIRILVYMLSSLRDCRASKLNLSAIATFHFCWALWHLLWKPRLPVGFYNHCFKLYKKMRLVLYCIRKVPCVRLRKKVGTLWFTSI